MELGLNKNRFMLLPLHQDPKDTARAVSFGFLRSLNGSDPRVIEPLGVTANICSNAGGCVILGIRERKSSRRHIRKHSAGICGVLQMMPCGCDGGA